MHNYYSTVISRGPLITLKIMALYLYAILVLLFAAYDNVDAMDIVFSGGVNETYDDNIMYSDISKKSDFITSLLLGVGLIHQSERTDFELSGQVSRNLYYENHKYDNTAEYANLRLRKELSANDRILITDVFNHSIEPRSFAYGFGRTVGIYSYYQNTGVATYTREVTRHFSVNLQYGNQLNKPSSEEINGCNETIVGSQIDYAWNPSNRLSIIYEYMGFHFQPGKNITYNYDYENDATVNSVILAYRFNFTNLLYLEVRAGENFIDSYHFTKYKKPYYSASIVNEIDRNTHLNITYIRQYLPSLYIPDTMDSRRLSCDLARQILYRFYFMLGAFWGKGLNQANMYSITFFGMSTSLTYEFNENLRFNISYTYINNESDIVIESYKRNAVTAGLTGQI